MHVWQDPFKFTQNQMVIPHQASGRGTRITLVTWHVQKAPCVSGPCCTVFDGEKETYVSWLKWFKFPMFLAFLGEFHPFPLVMKWLPIPLSPSFLAEHRKAFSPTCRCSADVCSHYGRDEGGGEPNSSGLSSFLLFSHLEMVILGGIIVQKQWHKIIRQ